MAKKKFAVYQNDNAFTLIETLFAFSLFILLIFFISPIFQQVLNNDEVKGRLQEMEWDVFCSQIKKEIHMSERAEVMGGRLFLTKDNQIISYEKYYDVLRRRVNNSGHEVLLQNVSEVTFTLVNNAVKIFVKSLDGDEFMITIYAIPNWNTSA
jgi:competence protein ComGF